MHDEIVIRGAREHNLRNIDLVLPRDRLIVFTGLSGSGKSSLAFDTIYAEGQRRYVESLSAYARQFLGQMDKPDVDFIEGLSPAISIDQKSASRNPRSTVGTITEVYDYLRLLFARIGVPHCPECGRRITRQTPQQIVDRVLQLDEGTRFQVLAPVVRGRKGEYEGLLKELAGQGFTRARIDGHTVELAEASKERLARYEQHTIEVVVDRLVRRAGIERRLTDSLETALRIAEGVAEVEIVNRESEGLGVKPGRHRSDQVRVRSCLAAVRTEGRRCGNPRGALPRRDHRSQQRAAVESQRGRVCDRHVDRRVRHMAGVHRVVVVECHRQRCEDGSSPAWVVLGRRPERCNDLAAERMIERGARRGQLGQDLAPGIPDDALGHVFERKPTPPSSELLGQRHTTQPRGVDRPHVVWSIDACGRGA